MTPDRKKKSKYEIVKRNNTEITLGRAQALISATEKILAESQAAKDFAVTIYPRDNLISITDDGKIKTSELIAECRKLFPVYVYCYDYDEENLDWHFPPPKEATTRNFKKTQEPDESMAYKSADDLKDIPCMTLRERIMFELVYFKETGNHLDIKYVTLCAGSRRSDGSVPFVVWLDGWLRVCFCAPDYSHDVVRSRAAV
jgi:hypothetical protein